MRFFYDLEFGDTASVVTFVSIGVVAEDGREYAAVSADFDPLAVHPWVRENVLPQLSPASTWKPRSVIAAELLEFFGDDPVWWAMRRARGIEVARTFTIDAVLDRLEEIFGQKTS